MSCKRCGACCLTIGRTFWKNGDFEDIPELRERANDGISKFERLYEDVGVPCEMFELRGDIGVCLIHERYGYNAKPKVCREYPWGDIKCFGEIEAGQLALFKKGM